MTITVNGTQITFPDATTQTTAGKSGTVTSVATGNGLSGGTITTSGTLVLACPTFNTVGSYCQVRINGNGNPYTITSGNNYSAGGGTAGVGTASFPDDFTGFVGTNNLSGTWKWLGSSAGLQYGGWTAIACRVS